MQSGNSGVSKRTKARYARLVERYTPASDMARGLARAFVYGGAICVVGQIIQEIAKAYLGFGSKDAGTFTSIAMIFIGALLTGIGKYDWIGKKAGAGSIVPITGFANSIVSAAMEFKREGFITGVGAKMFQIAGPVLVYGIGGSVVAGLIFVLLGW